MAVKRALKAKIIKFPQRAKFRPAPVAGGKCRLGCDRTVPTGTQTGICPTCLASLSRNRNQTAAWMLRYRHRTNVRVHRLEEIDAYPKGYRRGRPEKVND